MSPAAPVASSQRIQTLDVLRGFALLGILAMNIRAMAAPFSTYVYPLAMFDYSGLSRAAYYFTSVVFDLKMMGLFSMLFGAGVLLYAAKPTEDGKPPTQLWFRRMFWLLVIGLIHAYFIWDGDILVPYATCGLVFLWWARRLPAWALISLAVVFLSIGALGSVMHGLSWNQMPEEQLAGELNFWSPTPEQAQEQLQRMQGSYLDIVRHRAHFVFESQTFLFFVYFLWRCGGMMLLGMALLKLGILDGRRSNRFYALLAAACLPLGLAMATWNMVRLEETSFAMPERTLIDNWNYFGSVLTSVGYAAVLILMAKLGIARTLLNALAAVGQMAFTNYLTHSILGAIIFLGWGLGYAGKLDYAQQLVYVAAVWLLQLIVSPLWLSRFRFGPAEWLWRSLTYWELQPMRK